MTWFYSSCRGGFFDDSDKKLFLTNGAWPTDAVEISDKEYSDLLTGQMNGKIITSSSSGKPELIDKHDDSVSIAELEKKRLLLEATSFISPLQDAVDIDIATDKEIQLLSAWKRFRVMVNRIDTATAPDIEWPEKPVID